MLELAARKIYENDVPRLEMITSVRQICFYVLAMINRIESNSWILSS